MVENFVTFASSIQFFVGTLSAPQLLVSGKPLN